ncbi:MAG: hypothetical protein WD360_01090 [Nitriliruptoraceae bacterium]
MRIRPATWLRLANMAYRSADDDGTGTQQVAASFFDGVNERR